MPLVPFWKLVFQLAEVAMPRPLFQEVLGRIGRLCPAPGRDSAGEVER